MLVVEVVSSETGMLCRFQVVDSRFGRQFHVRLEDIFVRALMLDPIIKIM